MKNTKLRVPHWHCPHCGHCVEHHGWAEGGTVGELETMCAACLPYPCDPSPANLSVLHVMMFKNAVREMVTETGI